MSDSTHGGVGSASAPTRSDVKSEIAQTLIDAMERGDTPWQKPWNAQALRPMNPTSGNGYRGINRLLLALAGRVDPRWMTYQQAQAKGWQVRRGEKGTGIVKLVELGQADAARASASDGSQTGKAEEGQRKAFALRRYTIFNAAQIDGVPELEVAAALDFDPVERAESVMSALKEQTGLVIVHGGAQACYVPALDEVRLPPKTSFHSVHDYYATAMHEGAHSTLHEKRLDRKEALAKKWGDEAYAVEELRAEICSAILAAETGVPMTQAHIDNHAAYLKHWVKVVAADPMAIFSAAKDAENMAGYMLGLARQRTALDEHKEWIQDYERSL
jgi:antirestriction protein ArdC